MMASLLTIPRELRDKILILVISACIPDPQDISDSSNRSTLDDFQYDCPYFHGKKVLYIEHPKQTDTTSLLLVNRQLFTETLDAIRILPTKHSYVLDVIIAEEQTLWPTWLSIPILTRKVDKVYCQIRSIGFLERKRGIFSGGCGGPPEMTWALLNLVERFLRVGPVGRHAERGDTGFGIKEIVIDVRTPDVEPEFIAPERSPAMRDRALDFGRYGSRSKLESEIPLMRHPKGIAFYIVRDLNLIMQMCGDHGENGRIIFERVGSMKVLVDGEPFTNSAWDDDVVSEWDVADILAGIRYRGHWGNYSTRHWSDDQRRQAYEQWMKKAYESRVALGLAVKPRAQE